MLQSTRVFTETMRPWLGFSIAWAPGGLEMARKCDICGKVAVSGHLISHSHIRSKRVFAPNIQRVRALVNGTPRRINVCTRCLRSGKVVRAV